MKNDLKVTLHVEVDYPTAIELMNFSSYVDMTLDQAAEAAIKAGIKWITQKPAGVKS